MPNLEEVKEQIQKKTGLTKFLGRKEIKELPNILWEDETVENVIQGYYNDGTGLLVATNKRLIFIDKGIIKLKVEDFPYDKISSLQYETGIILGKMTVFTSGNRADIKNLAKNETRPFAEYVRARVTSKTEPASLSSNKSSDVSPSEDRVKQLERLAYLKHKGMLTQEEFNQEKKRLLSS